MTEWITAIPSNGSRQRPSKAAKAWGEKLMDVDQMLGINC